MKIEIVAHLEIEGVRLDSRSGPALAKKVRAELAKIGEVKACWVHEKRKTP